MRYHIFSFCAWKQKKAALEAALSDFLVHLAYAILEIKSAARFE